MSTHYVELPDMKFKEKTFITSLAVGVSRRDETDWRTLSRFELTSVRNLKKKKKKKKKY
jgi:hypothetical protein